MSNRGVLAFLALATVVACDPDGAAPTAPGTGTVARAQSLKGHYIVMLRDGGVVGSAAVGESAHATRLPLGDVRAAMTRTTALVTAMRGTVEYTYGSAIAGFAAQLSDSAVEALRADPAVLSIEPDTYVYATGTQTSAPWSLDRIDQLALPFDGQYRYPNTGAGVWIYMLDSGIEFANPEFGGRALTGYDAITAGGTATDCGNHGTETATIAAGSTYGVAKGATLYAVRVLDCSLRTTSSSAINGINYVAAQRQAHPTQPMIANIAISGTSGASGDSAVARLVALGVVVTIPAGNGATDACLTWPSRVTSAITVGAIDRTDTMWSSSNYGSCVDLLAPGVSVPTTYGRGLLTGQTGTSASSPAVAGAAALYLAAHPTATPAQVANALVTNASSGQVRSLKAGTPNRIASVAFMNGVTAANAAPTATISAPTGGTTFAQGATITFTGSGSDPETGALTGTALVWTSSRDGQIGTGTSFTKSTLTVGTHTITLTARDAQGATGTTSRTITVAAPTTTTANTAPVAAFTYSCVGLNPHQCAFDGSAARDDHGIVSWTWTWGDGRAETKTVAITKNTWAATGTYNVTLTVTDASGLKSSTTKAVAVP